MLLKTQGIVIRSYISSMAFSVLSFIRPLTHWMYGMAGTYYGMDAAPGFLPPKVSIHRGLWGTIFSPTRRIRLPKLSG